MSASTNPAALRSLRAPRWLATLWLLTATLSVLAVAVMLATVPNWHVLRGYLAQLGLWQTWISIAVCVVLLVISKRKHAESEEEWAQGALLIFVLGGLLTAVLLNYGVLPQWLVHSDSWAKLAQVVGLVLLHWGCAWGTWRSLRRHQLSQSQ